MIRITVSFSAQIRTTLAHEGRTVELPAGSTTRDLLRRLAAEAGEEFRRLVMAGEDELRSSTLLFVAGEQVRNGDTPLLEDGAEVYMTTPVAGG